MGSLSPWAALANTGFSHSLIFVKVFFVIYCYCISVRPGLSDSGLRVFRDSTAMIRIKTSARCLQIVVRMPLEKAGWVGCGVGLW
jgi:hypothetical protein